MTKAIVLGGRTGLLGQSLVKTLEKENWQLSILDRTVCDILNRNELENFIESENPDFVINAIAYTQVDQAEDNQDEAFMINKNLVQNLALILARSKTLLVHYSTDFVYNGNSNAPYKESDKASPINVYGASKYAGEQAIEQTKELEYLILRVSWLFGQYKKNFVSTVINKAKEMPKITVVHDQIGSPSYTADIADATLNLIKKDGRGLFNFTNSGQASWCELASEAIRFANIDCFVQAINAADYPHKAARPAYSVLDTQKYKDFTKSAPRAWTIALNDYIYKEFLTKA